MKGKKVVEKAWARAARARRAGIAAVKVEMALGDLGAVGLPVGDVALSAVGLAESRDLGRLPRAPQLEPSWQLLPDVNFP